MFIKNLFFSAPVQFDSKQIEVAANLNTAESSMNDRGEVVGKRWWVYANFRRGVTWITWGLIHNNYGLDRTVNKTIQAIKADLSNCVFDSDARKTATKALKNLNQMISLNGGSDKIKAKVNRIRNIVNDQENLEAYKVFRGTRKTDAIKNATQFNDCVGAACPELGTFTYTDVNKQGQPIVARIDRGRMVFDGTINSAYEGDDVDESPQAVKGAEPFRTRKSFSLFYFIMIGAREIAQTGHAIQAYELATANQSSGKRMSLEKFENLCLQFNRVCGTFKGFTLMKVMMSVHDTCKIKHFQTLIQKLKGESSSNHDTLLLWGLEMLYAGKPPREDADSKNDFDRLKGLLPSFVALTEDMQLKILNGWRMKVNLNQFIQGENFAADLQGFFDMKELDPEAAELFSLHDQILDAAGTAGFQEPDTGPILLDGDHFEAIDASRRALWQSKTPQEAWRTYMGMRAQNLGLNIDDKVERVVTRLCCALRFYHKDEGAIALDAFKALPAAVQERMINEWERTGYEKDQKAILMYYLPALVQNNFNTQIIEANEAAVAARAEFNAAKGQSITKERAAKIKLDAAELALIEAKEAAVQSGVILCDRIYQDVRTGAGLQNDELSTHLAALAGPGVYEINVRAAAMEVSKRSPYLIAKKAFEKLAVSTNNAMIEWIAASKLIASNDQTFEKAKNITQNVMNEFKSIGQSVVGTGQLLSEAVANVAPILSSVLKGCANVENVDTTSIKITYDFIRNKEITRVTVA